MSKKIILKYLLCITLLTAVSAMAQTPYDDGQKALREQRWMDAASQFEKAIKADKDQADAAMYWRAHALYKAKRDRDAERQIRKLASKYPDSRWVREAQVLQIEHQDSEDVIAQEATDGSVLDDELRMFALSQLMDRNPERAMPLVLDLLHNSESDTVREYAFFVLGMSEDPAALQAIVDFARESSDPELQVQAIHILGIASSENSLALLSSLYNESSSHEVKEAVIHAYIVADELGPLLSLLESESDPELQLEIIHALGVMEATEELSGLYDQLADLDSRKAVLEALSIADDTDGLFRILQTEKDTELRAAAIHALAISGGQESSDYLVAHYPNASDQEKSAVIRTLMIMEDSEGLLGLLKQETDPELKREMLQMLMAMGSEESDEYMFELLENEG